MRMRLLIAAALLLAVAVPVCAGEGTDPGWLKGIPLDKAIRLGSGKHLVIEVSDPDCRFSRRMSRYWSMRKDVTRYVFLVALKNHPDAQQKARYILAAADKAHAYDDVMTGELDFDDKWLAQHYDDGGLLKLHGEVAARLGAIGTPTYFVEGVMISGARVREIEQILGGEKIPFDAGDSE